jgi:hypothetical protein
MKSACALILFASVLGFVGCAESETPKPQEEVKPVPVGDFAPIDSVPVEFQGKRDIETWSQWAASFEVATYINGKPSRKKPDAKHIDPFVRRIDGKNTELLVSHKVSNWDPTQGAWRSSWRWTLARVVEPGKLQIYTRSANQEDRPATAADVPAILEKKPRVVELR